MNDYTYGEFRVDRITLDVSGGSVPIDRTLVLDLGPADQADPEVAALLAYVRRKDLEQIAAARPPDGWSLGPVG